MIFKTFFTALSVSNLANESIEPPYKASQSLSSLNIVCVPNSMHNHMDHPNTIETFTLSTTSSTNEKLSSKSVKDSMDR